MERQRSESPTHVVPAETEQARLRFLVSALVLETSILFTVYLVPHLLHVLLFPGDLTV